MALQAQDLVGSTTGTWPKGIGNAQAVALGKPTDSEACAQDRGFVSTGLEILGVSLSNDDGEALQAQDLAGSTTGTWPKGTGNAAGSSNFKFHPHADIFEPTALQLWRGVAEGNIMVTDLPESLCADCDHGIHPRSLSGRIGKRVR